MVRWSRARGHHERWELSLFWSCVGRWIAGVDDVRGQWRGLRISRLEARGGPSASATYARLRGNDWRSCESRAHTRIRATTGRARAGCVPARARSRDTQVISGREFDCVGEWIARSGRGWVGIRRLWECDEGARNARDAG